MHKKYILGYFFFFFIVAVLLKEIYISMKYILINILLVILLRFLNTFSILLNKYVYMYACVCIYIYIYNCFYTFMIKNKQY